MYKEPVAFLVPVIAIAIAILGACGPEAGTSGFADQEVPEVWEEEIPTAEGLGEGPGAGTMVGTWLKVHQASSCVLGQEQVTHAYYLVEFEEEGTGLIEHRRLCELSLSPLLGFRPVASPEVLESIEFAHVDRGFVTRLVPGGAYTSATELGLWGMALDDPLRDSMPTSAEDPSVIDGDGDGNPGVSLALEGSGCSRYMAQRQMVRYFGEIVAPNDIRGTSATITETVVLGASASICELAPEVQPNDGGSVFRMVRIDGRGGAVDADEDGDGSISCEEIAPFLSALVEVREPEDGRCG